MQVHNLVDVDAHLKTLRRWKGEGKIKYIGVTHYTTSSYPDLIDLIGVRNSISCSSTIRWRRARPSSVCCHCAPTKASRSSSIAHSRTAACSRACRTNHCPSGQAEFGAKSWAQVFLKFVLAHPAVTCVVPATGKFKNLVDNLSAGMGPLPTPKQCAQIVAALE
jgi:diketogulonate reductase-like aldo/keto reductase